MRRNSETLSLPAAQQPEWASMADLAEACEVLGSRPPLVDASSCHALRRELEAVARGEAFVIQGGDCAERFADAAANVVTAKAGHLEELADFVQARIGAPVVRIGRFAGQYVKPRSTPVETLPDGTVLPVYRGDAVNSSEPNAQARKADARRLITAYDHAAQVLDTLHLNQFLPPTASAAGLAPGYVSHEALLLDFEQAMVRSDPTGGHYGSSAHMLWIGERTRQLDGAHLAFAQAVTNPVGVKFGPSAAPDEVVEIVERMTADHIAGRLVLIVRMGASAIADRLPAVLDAVRGTGRQVVWLCDPMHGNTTRTRGGQKTRVLTDVLDEVKSFFTITRRHGAHPGGLHLEMTTDAVTECVGTHDELATTDELPRYMSACDPRLDAAQSQKVVDLAVGLL